MTGWLAHGAAVALTGLVLDALIGWPAPLFRRISHPVVWMGALINLLEGWLNRGGPRQRRIGGMICTALCVILAAGIACAIHLLLGGLRFSWLVEGALCWPLIAARSMWDHVAAVIHPLRQNALTQARQSVAMIVGRDVSQADQAAVARAATESLAENASDGVIAPLFWAAVAGLPGIVAYKTINTLDSMIGHRNARYLHFGRFAARLDDLVNLIPARLTAFLFALASIRPLRAIKGAIRQAGQHRSPNAGWPESAMAHALGIRLSGPRIYGDTVTVEPWLNGACPDPDVASLGAGLRLYLRATLLMAALLAVIAAPLVLRSFTFS